MSEVRRKRRWRRGCLILLVLAGLTVLGGVLAAEYLFDEAFYQGLAEEKIEALTGLPTQLTSLDIALFPAPRIEGRGLVVGEGDFRAEAARLTAGFDIRELLRGGNATGQVRVDALRVQLPEDPEELSERVSALMASFRARPAGEPLPLELHRVVLEELEVWQGDRQRVRGRGEILNALEPRPTLQYALHLPTARGEALAEGSGHLNLSGDGAPLVVSDGTVAMDTVDLAEALAPARTALDVSLELRDWNDMYATFSGGFGHPSVDDGTVQGKIWRRDGQYIANDVLLEAPGLHVVADFTHTPGEPTAIHVMKGELRGQPFQALLSAVTDRVAAGPNASLTVSDLTFGAGEGAPPRFVEGKGEVSGLQVRRGTGWPALGDLGGAFTVAENVFTLEEFGDGHLTASGAVTPDFDTAQVAVSLSGTVRAEPGWIPPESLPAAISAAEGLLYLDSLDATFSAEGGVPADLRMEGRLENGRIALSAGKLQDEIQGISGHFSGGADTLDVELAGQSASLGSVTANGTLNMEDQRFSGASAMDLTRAMLLIQREGVLNPYLKSLCSGYGASRFDVQAAWGGEPSLKLTRAGAPRLEFFVAPREGRLERVDASGDVDLAWFAAALPPRVSATGEVPVVVALHPDDQGFSIDANLNEATLSAGKYLKKNPGDHTRLEVTGHVVQGKWTPEEARIACLGETVTLAIRDGAVAAQDFSLRLPELVKLLPPGATAAGMVSGNVRTKPLVVDVVLADAGFGVSPEVKIDGLDGHVAYRDQVLMVDGLRVMGADSDCTVSAGLMDGAWTGRIEGQKLNLNAVEVMYDSARSLYEAKGRPEAPEAVARHRLTGRVGVDIQELYYRRGRLDNVSGQLLLEDDRIRLEDLAFQLGRGRAAGKAWVRYAADEQPAVAAAQVEAQGIDLKAVDDFALEKPRGMRGTADVNLAVRFPVGTGKPWVHGMDGALVFTAHDGTYGRLGHGGALLSVLKTTSLFRLKLPQYRDQGLSFQDTAGRIEMTQGVIVLEPFTLEASSHAMEGEVRIDYPADTIAGEMRVYFLESVTGLLDKVPLIGGAADAIKERSGLRVAIGGTPEEPTFGRPEETRFERRPLVRGGQEALRQGATAVEDGLRAGTRSIRNSIEAFGF